MTAPVVESLVKMRFGPWTLFAVHTVAAVAGAWLAHKTYIVQGREESIFKVRAKP